MATPNFVNMTFDDRNKTYLTYTGGWYTEGTYIVNSTGERGTLSSAKGDANVTFSIPVPARAFRYWAIPRCCGGLYAICVDCEPTAPDPETIDGVQANAKGDPIVMYEKHWDTPGLHEIILMNQYDTRFEGGNSQITLDRFEIEVEGDGSQTSSTSSSSVSTPSSGFSSSPSTASPSTTSITPSPGPPVGAIAGGAVGGVAVLAMLLGLCFFLRRRKRRSLDGTRRRQGTPTGEPYLPSDMEQRGPIPRHSGWTKSSKSGARHSESGLTSSSGQSHAEGSRASGRTRVPRRETDAGRLDEETEDDDAQTLPPDYDQVFRRNREARGQPPLPTPGEPVSSDTGAQNQTMKAGPQPVRDGKD